MIDVERIKALSELPSPRVAGTSQTDATGILRALSGLHSQAAPMSQPIAWSSGLCAQHPPKEGDATTAVAASMAKRVCRFCPIRAACQEALSAARPVEARQWREWAEGGGSSNEQ